MKSLTYVRFEVPNESTLEVSVSWVTFESTNESHFELQLIVAVTHGSDSQSMLMPLARTVHRAHRN
jgi:hypothetical protein